MLQGPEVRSGDVPKPIFLEEGQEFNFTIKRGVSTNDTVSVNYDDFINDVAPGDILLVDGKSCFITLDQAYALISFKHTFYIAFSRRGYDVIGC